MSKCPKVAVVGAGIGGLACAIDLARQGCRVDVFDRADSPGGKLRELQINGARVDAGPTVFTLPHVFEGLFADAGDDFHRRVGLTPAHLLARHAWHDATQLDLYADVAQSEDAIAAFAGLQEAEGYRRFAADARRIYRTLEQPYMQASRPSLLKLLRRIGYRRLGDLFRIDPFRSLWGATGRYFRDPRLRQLFSRYATYCGSSPFCAPATLMLIAHVEQAGVYYLHAGMHQLARELAALAERLGVTLHLGDEVVKIDLRRGRAAAIESHNGGRLSVDAVVCNADSNSLSHGLFGPQMRRATRATPPAKRSLSAITVALLARTSHFKLAHHTVFFSSDYRGEFDALFRENRVPTSPTIYVCAQDRRDAAPPGDGRAERLFCLINAPAIGDRHTWNVDEASACESLIFENLSRFGLTVQPQSGAIVTTTPSDFNRLFPATGGALYGPASHGWRASFTRTGSRTSLRGIYLAGGSAHPGPGVPMAALSGRLAAACVLQDFASTSRFAPMSMPGGISTV